MNHCTPTHALKVIKTVYHFSDKNTFGSHHHPHAHPHALFINCHRCDRCDALSVNLDFVVYCQCKQNILKINTYRDD